VVSKFSRCNLFIVRHGESQGNALGLWQGHKDYNLTKKGEQQALLTKQYFSATYFDKLQTSDLTRAIQTIEIIRSDYLKSIEVESSWKELSFGSWEGKSSLDINRGAELLDFWYQNPTKAKIPGGETFIQLQQRVLKAYNSLYNQIQSSKSENVLLVAHGGSIRVLGCYLAGIPLSNLWRLGVKHCSVSRILITPEKSTIVSWNHTSHLK
jgi:broad specificity phosphatase PhoE|tara:strand:- start:1992 stop:2621 length:630 start_codon:yes stop_codon:yes gene_type:complete